MDSCTSVQGKMGTVSGRQCRGRILILNWRDPENPLAGGAEHHIWEVFSRLVERGWEVRAICARFRGAQKGASIRGIEVTRCGGPYHYSIALPAAARKAAREFLPDLTIDFLNKLPLFSPVFLKGPRLCFVHHLFGTAAVDEVNKISASILRGLERLVPGVYASTDFLTGSESTRSELIELGVAPSRIRVVPYGVDTAAFCPGNKSETPSLVYIGRVKKYKGLDRLIRILPAIRKQFPDIHVDIAGRGDAIEDLKKLARSLDLNQNVSFLGYVTDQERLRLYQKAWLAVFPSRKEGFGLTVAEAALCGTPTVGYDVPGLRDAITHGRTGMLVPYGDLQLFEEAIISLLTDDATRRDMGNSARNHYETFSWDSVTGKMEEAIRIHLACSRP